MLWMIVVPIPKGSPGDFCGIGLLDVIWKLIEVIDERLSKIELHDCFDGFRAKRDCVTGIIEAKLVQQLAYREQCPLYGIFLDLKKAYDAIDRERCLKIFEDSGAGPKCIRLLRVFWDMAELVYRASVLRSGLHGL